MARSIEVLAPLARPVEFLPGSLRIPLMGWFWVLFNISLVWLGITFERVTLCSVVVGSVDGVLIAVIAVAKASEKFQAAATGLLGGLGVNKVSGDASFVRSAANGVHRAVDTFMDAVAHGTCPGCEELHAKIEGALLLIVWTAIFVILASLIGEWVWASKSAIDRPENDSH